MVKPVPATIDELERAKNELLAQIEGVKKEYAKKGDVHPPAQKVQKSLDVLTEKVNGNATSVAEALERIATDSKDHTGTTVEGLRTDVAQLVEETEAGIREELTTVWQRLDEVDASVRAAFSDELGVLCTKIDEELTTMRKELSSLIEQRANEADDNLALQRRELDAAIAEVRREAAERDSESRSSLALQLKEIQEVQGKIDEGQDRQLAEARQVLEVKDEALEAALEVHRQTSSADRIEARAEAFAALAELRQHCDSRFNQASKLAERLKATLSEVEEVPTRRVEWLLRDVSQVLLNSPLKAVAEVGDEEADDDGLACAEEVEEDPETATPSPEAKSGTASYFSPKFFAAGLRDLQFEIKISQPSQELTLVFLSPKGVQLNVRLFAGSRRAVKERGHGDKGQIAHRFGKLKQLVSSEDDTLRVGVEILESIREISTQISTSEMDEVEKGSAIDLSFEGMMTYHRHINHRILPQVRREVEKMRSRMVRRVEWQIEQGASLPQLFPSREPICSPAFDMADIEGLQLVFYPSGYAGSMEGYCSLYLHCPKGVTLRFSLVAGHTKRDSVHTWDLTGAYGRTNMCRFDNSLLDAKTNNVLIAVEIDESQQELSADAKRPGRKPGLALEAASAVNSTIKLQRGADRRTLTEVQPLPGLWSSTGLGDLTPQTDGFREFGALKLFAPGATGRHAVAAVAATDPLARAATPTGSPKATLRPSESMPTLSRGLVVPPPPPPLPEAELGDTLPLLCGTSNEWGSDQGHGSPLLWAGKSRRARGKGF